jgi:predicted nucleic acid-binding protein
MRVAFDTTVLWGAFHRPAGLNFALLALAAERTLVLDGFITDVVGAEFWWRATQQGVKGPGQRVPRTYSEQELEPFLQAFKVLFEPASMERAPLGRSLGQYAGLVGRPLGEFLHVVTGKDREALLSAATATFPVTFESMDIADLHILSGALDNSAEIICSNDAKLLSYDPIGSIRVMPPQELAEELGLIESPTEPVAARRERPRR